jgi:hypothetical protein
VNGLNDSKEEIALDHLKLEFEAHEYIALSLLIEEGRLISILFDMISCKAHCAPLLSLSIMPYLALIGRDARQYLNKRLGANLPQETTRVAELRHHCKYLDNKMSVTEYCTRAKQFSVSQSEYFREGDYDASIWYVDGIAVGSSLITAVLIEDELGKYASDLDSGKRVKEIGTEVGNLTSAFLYTLSERFNLKKDYTEPSVRAYDFRQEDLMKAIRELNRGVSADGFFFLLLDIALSLNVVRMLDRYGITRELLSLKLLLIALYHAVSSIQKLINQSYGRSTDKIAVSDDLIREINGLITRENRKRITRLARLRNEMVHYQIFDFSFMGMTPSVETNRRVRNEYFFERCGLSQNDVMKNLVEIATEISSRIISLLGIPEERSIDREPAA